MVGFFAVPILAATAYTYGSSVGFNVVSYPDSLSHMSRVFFSILFPIPCIIGRFFANRSLPRGECSGRIRSLSFRLFPVYQNVFLKAVTLRI